MKFRILLLALGLIISPAAARADVKPHALISEGMVLQQKSRAKIWGTADKGEQVTVSFARKGLLSGSIQGASTQADNDGRWAVTLDAGDAGGPFELTIKGKNTITYKNIMVGEVWVCSGQSNMNWSVSSCDKPDKEAATSVPHNPNVRMFTVAFSAKDKQQEDTSGKWTDAKPDTVGGFSAVGYFFGRKLNEKLKVPIGLIHTSVGGTRIEAWMSKEALDPYEKPGTKINQNAASALYNGMIYPILNYRVKGAIWYQGESNTGNAFTYRKLHPAMIDNWRADFKNPELPFYFVQLAPHRTVPKMPGESDWAELREAQLLTLKHKNTGMAVLTDLGDEADIHPTPKKPVGERLALSALGQTYGQKIVYSGPIFKSAKIADGKVTISFEHVGGGLVGKELVQTPSRHPKAPATAKAYRVKDGSGDDEPLVGFTICGTDKMFRTAFAEIVGNTVVVSCEKVADPVGVRYGWANHPVCNLFNREGLPASPFRTDDFKITTQPK